MNITERIDRLLIGEGKEWKKVVRKGKVIRKLICPPGYKAVDGKCVKMSPMELLHRKKSAMKAQRKLAANPGAQARMQKKKAKSLRKRAGLIPQKATEPN